MAAGFVLHGPVTGESLSGRVRYDVVRRTDSSCWDAIRQEQMVGATDVPASASGCVHLWQWTAVDLVRVFS